MADKDEMGWIERMAGRIRKTGWKVVERIDGKESVALAKEAQTAYLDGRWKDGFGLAMDAKKKAVGYALETIEHAAAKAKRLVTGGESVNQPGSPVTPAQAESSGKEHNAR